MISLPKRASEWCYAASKYCGIQLIQIVALVAFSSLSNAAELGELRVYSTLGEPLKAEIALNKMEDIQEQELEVRLASEEASKQSGAFRENYLSDIRFSVLFARDGSKFIRIASDQPLEDPVLDLNLELSWPFGKITKKYSTLLKSSEQEPPSSSYGPVKEKDTLWSIAQKLRPNRSISVQQMMLAIQRKNANSFLENNINLLRAGTFLRIPSVLEIGLESREAALSEVRFQIDRYQTSWRAPTKAVAESEPPLVGGSELKLRSLDKKESLSDSPLDIDRLALQEEKLLEAVEQLEVANESINELNSRIERLSSELDDLSEAFIGKDKEIDALRRELRRKDKETIDLGKLLEITRSIHPVLNDPYWALGTVFGVIFCIIMLVALLRRSGSVNKEASDLTFDESNPLSAEPNFNESARQEKVTSEAIVKAADETFIDDVSEVRIKETSGKDIENGSVSDASQSVDRKENAEGVDSKSSDQDRPSVDSGEKVFGSDNLEDGVEERSPKTGEAEEAEEAEEDDIDSTDSKLDLARAYIEMGDTGGAKALLAEIVSIGSPVQQIEAKELLLRIETKSD